MTDILRIIIGTILMIIWLIGCFLPVLPGPLLSYAAIFFLHIGLDKPFSHQFLIIRFVVTAIVTILDNIIPILGTKKMWGTKRWTRGATIGLIIWILVLPILGITLGPFGLIWILGGPFLGALIGEYIHGKSHPLKSAMGSFLWFLAGTILKLAVSIALAIPFFRTSRDAIKNLF